MKTLFYVNFKLLHPKANACFSSFDKAADYIEDVAKKCFTRDSVTFSTHFREQHNGYLFTIYFHDETESDKFAFHHISGEIFEIYINDVDKTFY